MNLRDALPGLAAIARADHPEFDEASAELLRLFDLAVKVGKRPRDVDPAAFVRNWTVLNAQPFELRAWFADLLSDRYPAWVRRVP